VKIITASEEPRVLTALRGHSVTIPCPHNYTRPTVSVSHVEESSGPPILLCSAQDFYPEGIMQVWLRDGQPLNATQGNISANVDGSFSISTPLPLSSEHTEDVLYSCWVNHSTLSKPITASYNFSPTGDNTAVFKDLRIIATVCGVAFAVIVFGLVIVIRFTNFSKSTFFLKCVLF
ncbi:hypothetical protein JZ751_022798, partial [Albula glossodonta]